MQGRRCNFGLEFIEGLPLYIHNWESVANLGKKILAESYLYLKVCKLAVLDLCTPGHDLLYNHLELFVILTCRTNIGS